MITAAVIILVAGFAMGIGYIWGSHDATENILAKVSLGYALGEFTTRTENGLVLKEENGSRTSK